MPSSLERRTRVACSGPDPRIASFVSGCLRITHLRVRRARSTPFVGWSLPTRRRIGEPSDHPKSALESRGVKVLTFDGPGGRTDVRRLVEWLGEEKRLSLIIEAGSMLNWAALDSGIVNKVFFYYAPKILGGTEALPVAGGPGRRRRMDAILLDRVQVHSIAENEFAVEGYVRKDY